MNKIYGCIIIKYKLKQMGCCFSKKDLRPETSLLDLLKEALAAVAAA